VYIDEAGMDNRENYSYGWNEKVSGFTISKVGGGKGGLIQQIRGL